MQRELPGRFEIGLVEAGKSLARVDRFELRVNIPLAAILQLEQPVAIDLVEGAAILDAQLRGARGDRRGGRESGEFGTAGLNLRG